MFQQANQTHFTEWNCTPATGWKKPIVPGRNPYLEKRRLGMLPETERKTKKSATKNGRYSTYYLRMYFKPPTK